MLKVVKDMRVSKNFKLSEFVCKEGKQEVYMDIELIQKLQLLRDKLGKPISIVSGYRSPSYNARIGGASKSQHVLGKAVDIRKVSGVSDAEFKQLAISLGFKGIGIYKSFWHVDVRSNPNPRGYSFWQG